MGYGDYGFGKGLILLSNLRCQGSESRLADCPSSVVGNNLCSHIQDSGVICVGEALHRVCSASLVPRLPRNANMYTQLVSFLTRP